MSAMPKTTFGSAYDQVHIRLCVGEADRDSYSLFPGGVTKERQVENGVCPCVHWTGHDLMHSYQHYNADYMSLVATAYLSCITLWDVRSWSL